MYIYSLECFIVFPSEGLHSIEIFSTKVCGSLLAISSKGLKFFSVWRSFGGIHGDRMRGHSHFCQKVICFVVPYILQLSLFSCSQVFGKAVRLSDGHSRRQMQIYIGRQQDGCFSYSIATVHNHTVSASLTVLK